MVSAVRRKLTFSNVVSLIALFVVLGGTAFAAISKNSVGTKQLKPNAVHTSDIANGAVTTKKIKNNAVTGAQVNESTLGTVPNANHASSADSAGNAGNASTTNGQTVTRISALIPNDGSTVTVATIGNFTITGRCVSNIVENLVLTANGGNSDLKAEGNGNVGPIFNHNQGTPPESVRLDAQSGGNNNARGETSFSAAIDGGQVISGDIGYDDFPSFSVNPNCAVYGEVISG